MSDQISLSEFFGIEPLQISPPIKKKKKKKKGDKVTLVQGTDGSLAYARDWFQKHLVEGDSVECPCCDRLAAHRFVPIYNSDAHAIIWLLRAWEAKARQEWVHVPSEADRWLVNSRTFTKLQYWDLIESCPNEDSAKRTSGMWRPTYKGEQFAKNQIAIPAEAIMYDRQCLGVTGDLIHISDTFKNKFDYSTLMSLSYSDLIHKLNSLH